LDSNFSFFESVVEFVCFCPLVAKKGDPTRGRHLSPHPLMPVVIWFFKTFFDFLTQLTFLFVPARWWPKKVAQQGDGTYPPTP
jgi:hypothetical protein